MARQAASQQLGGVGDRTRIIEPPEVLALSLEHRMPCRVGPGHQGRGRPGHGFKDLVADGFGLQPVRPDQCDEAPATDRSGRRQVPQRRRRLAARQTGIPLVVLDNTICLVDLPSAQLTGVVSGQDLTYHATGDQGHTGH